VEPFFSETTRLKAAVFISEAKALFGPRGAGYGIPGCPRSEIMGAGTLSISKQGAFFSKATASTGSLTECEMPIPEASFV